MNCYNCDKNENEENGTYVDHEFYCEECYDNYYCPDGDHMVFDESIKYYEGNRYMCDTCASESDYLGEPETHDPDFWDSHDPD